MAGEAGSYSGASSEVDVIEASTEFPYFPFPQYARTKRNTIVKSKTYLRFISAIGCAAQARPRNENSKVTVEPGKKTFRRVSRAYRIVDGHERCGKDGINQALCRGAHKNGSRASVLDLSLSPSIPKGVEMRPRLLQLVHHYVFGQLEFSRIQVPHVS